LLASGEVNDGVDPVLAKRGLKHAHRSIGREIHPDERHIPDSLHVSRCDIVGDDNGVTTLHEQSHDVRSDITGAAGDENSHR
jgi:hypothetical protein